MSSSASITPSLSLTLAPPSTADERVLRRRRAARDEHLDLAVRAAGPPARGRIARRADDRRVRPVRRAERLVDVDVAELATGSPRTRGRSSSRPARSAGSRACIDVARARGSRPAARPRRPDDRGREQRPRSRAARASRAATGAIEYCGSTSPFGRPRWPATTTTAPLLAQPLDRGQHGRDAQVVLDHAVAQRHVEVGAQRAPAAPAAAGRSSSCGTEIDSAAIRRRRSATRSMRRLE